MKTTNQLMGIMRVVFGILWIGLFVLGFVHGLRGLDLVRVSLDQNFTVMIKNIHDVNLLLGEITDVMDRVEQFLGTIESSTIDASLTLGDTRPMLTETSQVVTQDVPAALDDVQRSMPSIIDAASSIDSALLLLSKFRFEIPNLFGDPWVISLGIDYDPEVPLETAFQNLNASLSGIPESMRGMEDDLDTANTNLVLMGDNLFDVAHDLDMIREQLADINPQLDMIIGNLEGIQISIAETQIHTPKVIETTQKWFIGVMIVLILSQIPSIYMGWWLTTVGGESTAQAI